MKALNQLAEPYCRILLIVADNVVYVSQVSRDETEIYGNLRDANTSCAKNEKKEERGRGGRGGGRKPGRSDTQRELLFDESRPGMPRIKLLCARYARHHSSIRSGALVDVVIPQINTLPCPEPPSIKSGLPHAMPQSPTMRAPRQSFRYGALLSLTSPLPSSNKPNQIKC